MSPVVKLLSVIIREGSVMTVQFSLSEVGQLLVGILRIKSAEQ